MHIHRRSFVLCFALIFSADGHAGDLVEIVNGIFPRPIDKQVLLFVHQRRPLILAHLKVRCELDGIRGARFLAKSTEYAARKIDPEKLRVPPPMFILGSLKRYAIYRASHSAQVAGNAPLPSVRVTREYDATSPSRRYVGLLLRIKNGLSLAKRMYQYGPKPLEQTEHEALFLYRFAITFVTHVVSAVIARSETTKQSQ